MRVISFCFFFVRVEQYYLKSIQVDEIAFVLKCESEKKIKKTSYFFRKMSFFAFFDCFISKEKWRLSHNIHDSGSFWLKFCRSSFFLYIFGVLQILTLRTIFILDLVGFLLAFRVRFSIFFAISYGSRLFHRNYFFYRLYLLFMRKKGMEFL